MRKYFTKKQKADIDAACAEHQGGLVRSTMGSCDTSGLVLRFYGCGCAMNAYGKEHKINNFHHTTTLCIAAHFGIDIPTLRAFMAGFDGGSFHKSRPAAWRFGHQMKEKYI